MSDTHKYITLTTDNFAKEVIQSNIPVLVDFWAAWCGPCRVMNPIINDLAEQWEGKVKVGKVNIDENETIASDYEIEAIPTILILDRGEVIDRIPSLVSQAALEEKLHAVTNTASVG